TSCLHDPPFFRDEPFLPVRRQRKTGAVMLTASVFFCIPLEKHPDRMYYLTVREALPEHTQ
ncbi:MAG: hypothetical protein IKW76_10190, partial [Clostridia bacterium]|nr:hypothetical protein [Clostridia bacterium]